MVKEAADHETEDRGKRDEIEAKNKLDSMVYNTEKILNENRDKIAEADRTALEAALEQGRKALESDNLDEINAATEELTRASHKMAEAMYQAAGGAAPGPDAGAGAPPPPGPPPGGEGGDKDGVIDAEFEESKS